VLSPSPPTTTPSGAPILTSPAVSDIQETTVDLSVSTDTDNILLYWYIGTSATAPSEADMVLGTGATANGFAGVSATGTQTINDAGTLSAGTTYYAYLMQTTSGLVNSNIAETGSFTTTSTDTDAPEFSSASIPAAGTTISIVMDEATEFGAGGNGGVTLSASGGAVTATYSSGETTTTLVYSLSRTIGVGETVTVSYTQPGDGWEDAAGNDVVSFSGRSVTNSSTQDITAPTVTSVVTSVNGTDIEINCTEAVQVGSGGNGGFTLTASGGAVTLTFDEIVTNAIFYDCSRTIGSHETLTLAYVQPGNGIEDTAGNDLASFSDQSVNNNSNVDTVAPTLSSATVTGSGTTLTLAFDETVNVGTGGNGGFVATMSGGASALTYSSGDGTSTLIYSFARTITETETGTLAYTQPGNGIEDDAGNDLVSFSGTTVVNTTAGVIQSKQQAAIRADSGTTGTYNEDFIALMKSDLSVSTGTFNELLIDWLQLKLTSTSTNLQQLKQEAATDRGVDRWQEIADPTQIGS